MDTTRGTTPVAPAQYQWLQRESARWAAAGLLDDDAAASILDLYAADRAAARRVSVTRLLVGGGAAFVGIGLIWLVAANLDQLPPLARWIAVLVLWVAALVGAEWLAARRTAGRRVPPALVGGVRLVAAMLLGAVIFQAAQSLQVPAYEPKLVGLWALGALAHAYLVRGLLPLLVGVAAAQVWAVWQIGESGLDGLGIVLCFVLLGATYLSVAALHPAGWRPFEATWRGSGVASALVGLFIAAIPDVEADGSRWTWQLVSALVVVAGLAVAGAVRSRDALPEIVGAGLVAAVATLLVLWEAGADADSVGAADWAHAGASVLTYVATALGVAALGIRRDLPVLTWLATGALVVFTTFQSFAVFARIIQGGLLFVVLGLVLVGTGFAFDRARRELAEVIA